MATRWRRLARLTVVAILVVAATTVTWTYDVRREVTPRVAIAIDDSKSTQRRDGAVCDPDAIARAIRDRCGADVTSTRLSETSFVASPLGDWLDALTTNAPTENAPAVVVLLSDGIVTHGASLASRTFPSRIVCVAVGSDTPRADIAWATPLLLHDDTAWRLEASLRATRQREPRAVVVTLRCGESNHLIAHESLSLPAGDSLTAWAITLPAVDGDATNTTPPRFVLEWSPVENVPSDDIDADDEPRNNRFTLDIPPEGRRVRTLLLDRGPRPEYRFLRETLRRLPECTLRTLLLEADDASTGPLAGPLAMRIDELNADVVASFDLILVGDVDLDVLPSSLASLLTSRPLLLIAGRRMAGSDAIARLLAPWRVVPPTDNERVEWTSNPLVSDFTESESPNELLGGSLTLRWCAPLDLSAEDLETASGRFRTLATVGGRPLVVLDEDRRWCWHGTDEWYRAAGVWGVAWSRAYWRRLVVFLGDAGKFDAARQHTPLARDENELEFRRLHRDTASLNALAAAHDSASFDAAATTTTPESIADAVVRALTPSHTTERRCVIPPWTLCLAAIALLLAVWWSER